MACLWEYRIWVGMSPLILLFLVIGVYVRGQLTEQNLWVCRFDHTKETPLDATGEPRFWKQDMKENSHRMDSHTQKYYQGYHQE